MEGRELMFRLTLDHFRQAAGIVTDTAKQDASSVARKNSGKPSHKGKKLRHKTLPAVLNMKKVPTEPGLL
jgi:hypothetical protein